MPTVNALFSHQISVIMGDFPLFTALTHLVGLGDLEALQAADARVNRDDAGEMRQLAVTDPLSLYRARILRSHSLQDASLSDRCELGPFPALEQYFGALVRSGRSRMAFQIADDCWITASRWKPQASRQPRPARAQGDTPLIHALRAMSPSSPQEVERLFDNETVTDDDIASVVERPTRMAGSRTRERGVTSSSERAHRRAQGFAGHGSAPVATPSISYVMERHS